MVAFKKQSPLKHVARFLTFGKTFKRKLDQAALKAEFDAKIQARTDEKKAEREAAQPEIDAANERRAARELVGADRAHEAREMRAVLVDYGQDPNLMPTPNVAMHAAKAAFDKEHPWVKPTQ